MKFKFILNCTLLSFSILLLPSCAKLQKGSAPNQFIIEKPFVRDTLNSEYLKGRRIHRFQPILFKNLVIAGNGIDGIKAFDRISGQEKWNFTVQDGVEGGASLHRGKLFFGAGDGQFYSMDAESGKVIWSASLKAEGISEPTVETDVVYVLSGNNVARAMNNETGQLIWVYDRQERSNLSVRGGSRPAVDEEKVYFGFSDGYLVALSKTSGQLIWESNLNPGARRFRDVDASPIILGKDIIVSSYDGGLYSLNKETGQIQWKIDEGGYEEIETSGRALFFSTTSGKVIAADRNSGKIFWETQLKGNLATSPTYTQGLLIVGEYAGGLVFLDPLKGSIIKRFDPGMGVNSKATVDAETSEVYFMSGGANLYGLRYKWARHQTLWPWQQGL